MAVEVRIPTILRTFTSGEKAVQGDGSTLLQPSGDVRLAEGDGVALVAREAHADILERLFSAPKP